LDFSGIADRLSASPLTAFPLVFLAGVLTSFTPCIYPMIPITAAIVGGTTVGEVAPPRARVVLLTFSYVMGLALAYAALGLVAGLTGTIFGSISTNPWLYFAMANLLVIAALAMLDVIPIRVPAWLMQRAATAGTGGRAGGLSSWDPCRGSSPRRAARQYSPRCSRG
jgi:thiol:disulfide interchange protein DsbD